MCDRCILVLVTYWDKDWLNQWKKQSFNNPYFLKHLKRSGAIFKQDFKEEIYFTRTSRIIYVSLWSSLLPNFQQLLAGSRVNEADKHRQTCLHLAAANNTASIISVLLENGIDPDAMDEKGNNGMIDVYYWLPIMLR